MGDDLFYPSSTIMLFLVISNSLLSIATLVGSLHCIATIRDGDRWEAIKMLQL